MDYANNTNVEFIVDLKVLFHCWLIYSYLQIFKLIKCKWLPGECADWFFDNIMTWSYRLHGRYSMSRQKNSILINEHALNRERIPLHQWRVYHRDSHFSFRCLFVLFLALQGSDPNWYTALINVLDGEQTRALQDVFVQAEQRKNALGESRGLFQQILSFTCSILTYSRKTVWIELNLCWACATCL